jgi:hypothetical protein
MRSVTAHPIEIRFEAWLWQSGFSEAFDAINNKFCFQACPEASDGV